MRGIRAPPMISFNWPVRDGIDLQMFKRFAKGLLTRPFAEIILRNTRLPA